MSSVLFLLAACSAAAAVGEAGAAAPTVMKYSEVEVSARSWTGQVAKE